MINKPILIAILILLQLVGISVLAQKSKISNTTVEIADNKMVVKYDLLGSKATKHYKILFEITNSTGLIIPTKNVSGDVGNNITGGPNKQIVWDYNADGIVYQDDINIQLSAVFIYEDVKTSKALMLSTLCPGLGISAMEKGKPYWLLGLVSYGCLGYSYILNKKGYDNYTAYLNNSEDNLNDKLLKDSQDQKQISKTLGYAAAGVWGINLIWTAIKAKSKKSKSLSYINKNDIMFYSLYDPLTKTSGFSLKISF